MSEENYNGVSRDTNMDLIGALKTTASKPKPEQESAPETAFVLSEKPKMSALDQAIAAKKNANTGILDDAEAAADEAAPIRPAYDSDEEREVVNTKVSELANDQKKAESVVVIRQPGDPAEYAQMLTEVEAVSFDENGQPIIPEGAEFIIAKTPEVIAQMEQIKAREASAEEHGEEGTNVPMDVDDAKHAYKTNIVKILIDKTGMGANIHFDDEESKAIEVADVIQLCEVENEDLQVMDVERIEDGTPFMQAIAARQMSVSKVPMVFPGSGFKAQMSGLSFGEFSDIALNTDSANAEDYLNFDKLYNRYSVVYNNMKNVSVGPFKDFDSFLHKFAHDDLDLAIYGLMLATQPDIDSIYIHCQKNGCKKRFLYHYAPRGVIDLDTASVEMLEAIDRIERATPDERLNIFKNSRVNKFRRIKLPVSGYLVDIGLASAYDYLYQILPIVQNYAAIEDTMSDTDPRRQVVPILFGVRNIWIPMANGKYARAFKAQDIADVILSLPTHDESVLEAAVQAYRGQYRVGFSLKNLECPHCHTKTSAIRIDVDTLVFQIRLQQINTHVAVKNFPVF